MRRKPRLGLEGHIALGREIKALEARCEEVRSIVMDHYPKSSAEVSATRRLRGAMIALKSALDSAACREEPDDRALSCYYGHDRA